VNIVIHTSQEAVVLAIALQAFVKDGLTKAGALVERINEDPFYTNTREFLHSLEKFIKNRS
jgi:hypothetical protein